MNFPRWLVYAVLSAVSAAFVGIFAKVGMPKEVNSSVATAIRGVVMALLLCLFCTAMELWPKLETIPKKAFVGIILSGAAGATSWLFYFRAIQLGEVSKVAPIDKLSMPFAVLLAVLVLGDRPAWFNWIGVGLIVGGGYLASLSR
ncbi:MAG TPA: EamA family transporter [Tepidisphaeraceae bacterium]|jgi:transporter family protein|nr:EamA family transporter [Tepidisphaeraceae bacterium]